MTVQTPPWAIQGQSHPAEDLRRFWEFSHGPTAGIVSAAGALKVTERAGTPTAGIDVAEGIALIDGTTNTYQGFYTFDARGVTQLAVGVGDATNPRKDLVVARIRDNNYDGSGVYVADLAVIPGTPAASPAEPAVPANSLVLAMIDVPALDAVITNSQITDRRVASSVWTRPRGLLSLMSNTTTQSAIAAGPTTLTGTTTPSLTIPAGRRIKVFAQGQGRVQTAAARYTIEVQMDSAGDQRVFSNDVATGERFIWGGVTYWAPAAGGHVFRAIATRTTGTGTLDVEGATAGAPTTLVVEDFGGYLV